jgi:hypothetical protein
MHILTGAKGTAGHASKVVNANMQGIEFMSSLISMVHPIERSLTSLVFGGVFERFPRLRIVSAETTSHGFRSTSSASTNTARAASSCR